MQMSQIEVRDHDISLRDPAPVVNVSERVVTVEYWYEYT